MILLLHDDKRTINFFKVVKLNFFPYAKISCDKMFSVL